MVLHGLQIPVAILGGGWWGKQPDSLIERKGEHDAEPKRGESP